MPHREQPSVTDKYQKLEIVGKGSYGSVHKGIEIATGKVVALKIINLDTEDDDVGDIQREVNLLSQLRGTERSNVTMYYGCYLEGPRVWIIMDFASGGSVRTLMKATKNNVVEERFSVVIVRESLIALAFLHKSGVIHRDVKAANILVTHTGRVVLCDFGVSALLATTNSKRNTFVGTPHWMAPEVITSGSLYDAKADIWSLGVTIYEMITGGPPHGDQLNLRAIALIPKSKPPRLPENAGSKEMKDLVSSCLRELPGERPSAEELLKTKWIKSSSKVPVSSLRELLTIYDAWALQGGVRASIAGDDDMMWEDHADMDDTEDSTWEFGTVRARDYAELDTQDGDTSYDSFDNYLETTSNAILNSISTDSHRPPSPGHMPPPQPPRSLRMLFEDSSLQPPEPTAFPRAPSPQQPSLGLRIPATADYDSPTPRQTSWNVAPSLRAPSPAGGPPPTTPPEMSPKNTYRDVRNSKGLANISIPPPSISSHDSFQTSDYDTEDTDPPALSSSPESEENDSKDHSTALKLPPPNMNPIIRQDSDPAPSTPSRRLAPSSSLSPSPITFPSAAPPSPNTQATSNQRLPPIFPNGISTSSPARHLATTPAYPGLTRAATATGGLPFAAETAALNLSPRIKPGASMRHPPLARQASLGVMQTLGGAAEAAAAKMTDPGSRAGALSALSKGYKSDSDASGSSTLTVRPSPRLGHGLKDVLNLAPITSENNPRDLLPPSPSTHSRLPSTGHSPKADMSFASSITRDPIASSRPGTSNGRMITPASSSEHLASHHIGGPPIRPLDYSFMMSSDDLHTELSRVVEDLSQWLGAVDLGLAHVLEPEADDMDDANNSLLPSAVPLVTNGNGIIMEEGEEWTSHLPTPQYRYV